MTKLEISEKFKEHIKAKGLTGEKVSPMLYWEMIEFIDELVNKSDVIGNVSKCCDAMCDNPVHKEGGIYCGECKDL